MKKCKDCKKERWHDNPLISRCKECQYKKQNIKQKKVYTLKQTPVKKIWRKRKERIKLQWSEFKVFQEIWEERQHVCENCWKEILLFHSSCFAHKLNKRDHPDLRYEKDNIALVHGVFEVKNKSTWLTYNCHKEFDLKFKKNVNKTLH